MSKLGQEVDLEPAVAVERHVERRVLDQDLAAQRLLDNVDVDGKPAEGLSDAREGLQVWEALLANPRPGEVFGDQEGFEAVHQAFQRGQMLGVGVFAAGER